MSLQVESAKEPDQPSIARIRDFWLNGTHHTEADRELAEHIVVCAPHIPYLVRAQRALLARMVRYLVENGVRQFLDLGSGVPTGGHVHQIAQAVDPACSVAYVDIDPSIVRVGRRLLADGERTAYLQGDIREPEQVLEAVEKEQLLDFDEPVALLLVETLLHIPDSDDPAGIVRTFSNRLCSGSYLAVSHFSEDEQLLNAFNIFDRMFDRRPEVNLRSPGEVVRFFVGLDLVDPGVVPVPLWQPSSEDEIGRNPELVQISAGLARKP